MLCQLSSKIHKPNSNINSLCHPLYSYLNKNTDYCTSLLKLHLSPLPFFLHIYPIRLASAPAVYKEHATLYLRASPWLRLIESLRESWTLGPDKSNPISCHVQSEWMASQDGTAARGPHLQPAGYIRLREVMLLQANWVAKEGVSTRRASGQQV